MREIKKYVRFYIQKRKTWTDQSPKRPRNVVMMFNYDGKRLCTLTGLKIADCDWDASKQRVKLTVKRAKQVNGVFDLLEEKVNDIYYDAIGNGITPDNNHILRELKKDKKKEKLSLVDEWKRYLGIIKTNIKESSLESLTISFNHFEKFARGMRLDFDDITGELVSKYAAYLQGLSQGDNTVYKNVKRLRMFMNYAKKAGLHNNLNYNDFNVTQKNKRIVFLEWSEVKTLLDYTPKTPMERKALDNFLFGCLTSMRYSDYHALKRSDITKVEKITVIVQGETENIVVPLKTSEVNKIKVPQNMIGGLGVSIGRILDAHEANNFTAEEREALKNRGEALENLLTAYLSTLRSYSVMRQLGLKTIVITSLRSDQGYVTRVAGILPQRYDKVTCSLDGNAVPAYEGLVLYTLSTCPNYTEEYEKSSIFHKLKSEAASKGPMIKIAEAK